MNNPRDAGEPVIEPVIDQLPCSLRQLTLYERKYMLHPQRYQGQDARFEEKYFPQNCGAFELPCFWVSRRHMHVFRCAVLPEALRAFLRGTGPDQQILFPIHPATCGYYGEFLSRSKAVDSRDEGMRFWAVPTSSVRTLLAWPEGRPDLALFVKTSLPFRIGGGERCVLKNEAARGVAVSELVQCAQQEIPETFEFLLEAASFVPKAIPVGGVVLRTVPARIRNGPVSMAPVFALWETDGRRTPLLLKALQQTDESPLEYITHVLARPLMRIYLSLVLRSGLMPELHGQNLLAEVSEDGHCTGRFYGRDFELYYVDWQFRIRCGLPLPRSVPNAHAWEQLYSSFLIAPKIWRSVGSILAIPYGLDRLLPIWWSQRRIGGPAIERGAVYKLFLREAAAALNDTYDYQYTGWSTAGVYEPYLLVREIMQIRSLQAAKSSCPRLPGA